MLKEAPIGWSQSAWCAEVSVSQTHLEAAEVLRNLWEAPVGCRSQWQLGDSSPGSHSEPCIFRRLPAASSGDNASPLSTCQIMHAFSRRQTLTWTETRKGTLYLSNAQAGGRQQRRMHTHLAVQREVREQSWWVWGLVVEKMEMVLPVPSAFTVHWQGQIPWPTRLWEALPFNGYLYDGKRSINMDEKSVSQINDFQKRFN